MAKKEKKKEEEKKVDEVVQTTKIEAQCDADGVETMDSIHTRMKVVVSNILNNILASDLSDIKVADKIKLVTSLYPLIKEDAQKTEEDEDMKSLINMYNSKFTEIERQNIMPQTYISQGYNMGGIIPSQPQKRKLSKIERSQIAKRSAMMRWHREEMEKEIIDTSVPFEDATIIED